MYAYTEESIGDYIKKKLSKLCHNQVILIF